MREKYEDDFKAGMGAEAVKELLQINLEELSEQLKSELKVPASGQKSCASSAPRGCRVVPYVRQ